jgi:hypothetical protein
VIEPVELDGKRLLIGVTREHSTGKITQEQFAGTAKIEDRGDYCLVLIDCSDGQTRNYPFDRRTLKKAAPGEYRLRSTGEVIIDPDYLMTWIVTEGPAEE